MEQIKVGSSVHYSPIIGGPFEEQTRTVLKISHLNGQHVAWVTGLGACVSMEALKLSKTFMTVREAFVKAYGLSIEGKEVNCYLGTYEDRNGSRRYCPMLELVEHRQVWIWVNNKWKHPDDHKGDCCGGPAIDHERAWSFFQFFDDNYREVLPIE